jgi:biopolymer transport protein ExbD
MALKSHANRYSLAQNAEINVTPFVDVMLVLLIIFMVAIPAATRNIPLELPPAKAPTGPVEPPVVITVRPDGSVLIGDTPSSLARLSRDLARLPGASNPSVDRVYVRGERTARYRSFMDVMNALKRAGYDRIGLVAEDI